MPIELMAALRYPPGQTYPGPAGVMRSGAGRHRSWLSPRAVNWRPCGCTVIRSGTHARQRGAVAGEPLMGGHDPQRLLHVMKRAGAALKRADIRFALAGGMAAYARGAGLPTHDIDFVIMEGDAEAAAKALAGGGLRIEWPPEDWLFKAYDGPCMVDLILRPRQPKKTSTSA